MTLYTSFVVISWFQSVLNIDYRICIDIINIHEGHDFTQVAASVKPSIFQSLVIRFGIGSESKKTLQQFLFTGVASLRQELFGMIRVFEVAMAIVSTWADFPDKCRARCEGIFDTVLLDLPPDARADEDFVRSTIAALKNG